MRPIVPKEPTVRGTKSDSTRSTASAACRRSCAISMAGVTTRLPGWSRRQALDRCRGGPVVYRKMAWLAPLTVRPSAGSAMSPDEPESSAAHALPLAVADSKTCRS